MVLRIQTPANGYYEWGDFNGPNIWANGGKDAPFDTEVSLANCFTNSFIYNMLIQCRHLIPALNAKKYGKHNRTANCHPVFWAWMIS